MSQSTEQLQQENERLAARLQYREAEIAELRQYCERVSRSEARYRQVVENSPIAISFYSTDGRHTEENAAFIEKYGFTAEDSERVGFNIFSDPQLEENGTRSYMLRALAGKTVIEPPTNFYDASRLYGEKAAEGYIPGQGHYFPIWNEDREVQEIVEMSPSITDLLAAQADVLAERDRAAQERAQLLSTVAQVANLLLRASDYTAVLPDVVRLLGEAVGSDRCAITQELLESAVHQHQVRLLTEWRHEEVPSVLAGSPEFGAGVEIGIPPSFHQPLLQGEAVNFIVSEVEEPVWRDFFEDHHNVSMLIVPVMLRDGCWGHIGFDNCKEARLFDEAEVAILQVAAESIAAAIDRQTNDEALRESEKRYRTLFELSNEGIYRFEIEKPIPLALSPEERLKLGRHTNRIIEVNQAFAAQYGYDSPAEMLGARISYTYDKQYAEANHDVDLGLMRDLQCSNMETIETDRFGNRRWFISSTILTTCDNAIVGGWGVQNDITELKQAQQALLEAEQARARELEQYNAELQQTLDQLQVRDRILQATATAADALLTAESLEEAVNTALRILGESLDTDRVSVVENEPYENVSDLSLVKWELLYEWHSSHTISQRLHPDLSKGNHAGIETWLERLAKGESISYPLEELSEPFRSAMKEVGLRAIHEVPIFVEGRCWGVLAIDDCREAKQRNPAELAVLKTAAACIGGAIERERAQQALLKAEQDRVAELAKTNRALKNSLDQLATDPDLDAFLGYVLTEISQQLDARTATLYLYDQTHQTLNLHQWIERDELQPQQNLPQFWGPLVEPILVGRNPIWDCLLKNRFPLVINRDNADQYMFRGTEDWQLEWVDRENLQAGINILLISGEAPLGMLCLFSNQQRSEFTSEELEIAQTLSHQATLAIQLAQLAEDARQTAILDERNRMARDVHDTLAQAFTGVLVQLEAAKRKIASAQLEVARDHIAQARNLAQSGLSEARRSVRALRPEPLESNDLPEALQHLARQLTNHQEAHVEVKVLGSAYPLASDVEENLLRIVQEALANALRHAVPTQIMVRLQFAPDRIELRISDDGCGFVPQAQIGIGFGLVSMQERSRLIGGEFTLTSQIGQGAEIIVTVPIS